MIKVICLVNKFALLDKDKIYLASKISYGKEESSVYYIINIDTNKIIGSYDKKWFMPLAEMRENQIKSVLDE